MGNLNSLAVANLLIEKSGNTPVTHMKLQKLLYFANGWWLATMGERLLNENPEVWKYGPVFRRVYAAFHDAGNEPITKKVSAVTFSRNPTDMKPIELDEEDAERISPLIDFIIEEYGGKTATQLSDKTHEPGTPWRLIAEENKFSVPDYTEIPVDMDWEFFSKEAEKRNWTPKQVA